MKEEYKDIEGYENLYQISSLGNVKSLNKRKGRILKPAKNNKGYLRVGLCKQGKRKMYLVHRLVTSAFIENPNNLPQVNHKDEDKTNNAVENLEFCDAKYNNNYGTRNIRAAESNTNNPKQVKQGKQVLCLETNKIYPSLKEVQRQTGFAKSNISNACNGKLKQAYGYHWVFLINRYAGIEDV